jgi:anthranilate/para-aminobenzoate synthase component I
VQAGAGVVADSSPTAEFAETVHKASALLQTVERAVEGSGGRRG